MTKFAIACLAAALILSGGVAAAAETPGQLFLFIYHRGPAWKAGKPLAEQGLGPHGAYMRSLLDKGKLLAGGPFVSEEGGMALLRAQNEAEAKAMLAADPAVTGGIFAAEFQGWSPLLDGIKLKGP